MNLNLVGTRVLDRGPREVPHLDRDRGLDTGVLDRILPGFDSFQIHAVNLIQEALKEAFKTKP